MIKVSKEDRCKAEHRNLLALVLTMEPQARKMYAILMKMGAKNIRPDHMYVRQADGKYERMPDPGAWNCQIDRCGGMMVALIRHGINDWSLHS